MRVRALDPASSDMRYGTFGNDRFGLNGPQGLPITKPPYGRITAIDLSTGEHQWVMPLGDGPRDHPALVSMELPPLGWPSRGFALATRTLLFAVQEPAIAMQYSVTTNAFELLARTRAPRLSAFDKRTGQLLVERDLPANAGGSPMTLRAGGVQYIVVPVGGGGVPAELVALSLGGR
jgi:quinoprotein glucose dehydrogenase